MLRTRWLAVLLLVACATPDREPAPLPPATPNSSPAPTPRALANAICARSSERIAVTLEGDKAFVWESPVASKERVLYWSADLAANVHAIAISKREPKCTIVENCGVRVLVDCGDGYAQLLRGPSPSVRPELNPARLAAGQWLDLISLEPSQDIPDLWLRTRWPLGAVPEPVRQEVDCPSVDAGAPQLSPVDATPMKGLQLRPGKRLPPTLLPGETFRVPLGPLATDNSLRAIGYVEPGNSAGIVFATGECMLNEWFVALGHGVELSLDPAPVVRLGNGLQRALLLVKVLGTSRRGSGDDPRAPLVTNSRELVFGVDERRVRIAADSDAEIGKRVAYSRLEQQQNQVWLLATSPGRTQQRRLYDAQRGEFSSAPAAPE